MDGLVPCDQNARDVLAKCLFQNNSAGVMDKKLADYVARTFPSILLDIARELTEQATIAARSGEDPVVIVQQQLKPFLMFSHLLGKCPQITALMYSYFENSSFQPFPENIALFDPEQKKMVYSHPGFNDEVLREILITFFRYLSFNPKWFSAVWNWSELAKFITKHTDLDVRYLSACCLSVITRPTRSQHIAFLRNIINHESDELASYQTLVDLQIKHRTIFDNTFKPCLETRREMAINFTNTVGCSQSGYSFCSESIAKVSNILLLKSQNSQANSHGLSQNESELAISQYVPVASLDDAISRVAYSASINKPCLIRGPSGFGKTAILDYVAAHTNRTNPPEYVKVQIGDQLDSKLLIGSYVCTEVPGQFEWQPGPLTKAMSYGSWIVFDDIDCAPSDMAQVIHSVIENGNLSCVSCSPIKLDSPHPDFRIFFTQRTNQRSRSGFVEKLCHIIDLPSLTDGDLRDIIQTRYNFSELSDLIIDIFKKSHSISNWNLFRFCKRLSARNIQATNGKFSSTDLDALFLDAVDCFISHTPMVQLINAAESLGQAINLSSNDVQRLIVQRRPEIRAEDKTLQVGRVKLELKSSTAPCSSRSMIAYTKQSLRILEAIAMSVKSNEPILLVGETGVGKTSIVQHLADTMRTRLIVINLSQQSDSSDLLGGYKPVHMREIIKPLHTKLESLFGRTFDADSNEFLSHINNLFDISSTNSGWSSYLMLVSKLCLKALNKRSSTIINLGWSDLLHRTSRLSKRISSEEETPMALAFSEGSLLRAVKEGSWILLDEINLAEQDVLQCLLLILDSMGKSHVYMHSLDSPDEPVTIHPNFRIFACMNPSTDIGKRDLAPGIRGRFSEFFVDDVTDRSDLRQIVESYVKTCLPASQIEAIVNFYLEIKPRTNLLSDISGNPPVYSLRTLCRALSICSSNVCQNVQKSLLESLRITFCQQLNEYSISQVLKLIEQEIFGADMITNLINKSIDMPKDGHQYTMVEGFWIQKSNEEPFVDDKYIVTKSVKKNLQSLSRIISLSQRKLPILIQGNTSVGKTSLIMHLAKITGNRCYRVNNHEHTDLQDYIGRYVLKENGELVFQDGLLVRAMKKGYWIILDELNLAPSDLLEALNRVLDDNRELFNPETREVVKAHSKFILFATQNPPQEYSGRKLLSRAFRNRFIELHFDEIPGGELEYILHMKCEMPPKYAKNIVAVMKELQICRRESGCFNGKDGFMTMRDLFRWGERYLKFKPQVESFFDWDMHIATEGLILLEGRVRTTNEANTVKRIIVQKFNKELDRKQAYSERFSSSHLPSEFKHIYFSREFRKLYVQLSRAFKYCEPVLLCGQTGCGKTTACQLYAAMNNQPIITYNCHLNTESADFVGGVRPARREDSDALQTFPWVDGPLIQAMKSGAILLLDEISLADDAVLERINSVLEPTRSITLTEKDGVEIFANEKFRVVATMNPGGDYGKKELSTALRNRFTEIYCHNVADIDEISKIIEASLKSHLLKPKIGSDLIYVMKTFLRKYYSGHEIISIRDVINWCQFMNKTTHVAQVRPLSLQEAIMNGASLIFFDQFGTCGNKTATMSPSAMRSFLRETIHKIFGREPTFTSPIKDFTNPNDLVKFKNFYVLKGPLPIYEETRQEFIVDAPMVKKNLKKLFRAMQLDRPILLEGDPGAGKTSIVSALAKLTGNKLIRINLSEQTDISDLLGSDLPDTNNPSEDKPSFRWHDGPLLQAMKESQWVLLDEMNLASQSVLEGLNACFDHRGEIYIPELDKRIIINRAHTRIFACQNPYRQGAARKGLPQSFLNRFTSIFIESYTYEDLKIIISRLYPKLPADLVAKMIEFNEKVRDLHHDLSDSEFNLRDILYWCDLVTKYVCGDKFKELNLYQPERFVQFVYLDRVRSSCLKIQISDLFEEVFSIPVYEPPYREFKLGEHSFIIARSILPRKIRPSPRLSQLCILKYQMPYIESVAKAIEHNKMPILVGESGVGKRSLMKILAGLTGNELNILGANQEMDTIELLGSFEQRSFQREIVEVVDEAKKCILSIVNSIHHKQIAEYWCEIFGHMWVSLYATSIRDLKISKRDMMDSYRLQLSQMKELIERVLSVAVGDDRDICNALNSKINKLMKRSMYYSESTYSAGNFEWVDSILVKSIKEGSWLMIENANLMNPATLDRLNSLVEPNGCLSLNEKGSETLVPHQDFRLILTMDPDHCELSRAMRNRGVEIYVQSRFYFEDFLMLLNQNGFEPENDKPCMTYCIMQASYDAHHKITGEVPEEEGSLLAYFGLNYLSTLTHQVRRGLNVDEILSDLIITYYKQKGFLQDSCEIETRAFIKERMDNYRKKYKVNLMDERYKWRNLRHDLVSLSGGDAITAMIDRENRIFYDDFDMELLLKPDYMIDNVDIVNTCITVKIFLELSTHGDFEHRKGFIRETFIDFPNMMTTVNKYVDILHAEYIPFISNLLPQLDTIPKSDIHVDTRNSPDLHYYLKSIDYDGTIKREGIQNRWLLSLHRIMLKMIVELIEERSLEVQNNTSLWVLSERVKQGQMLKEDLIRPNAEIVCELFDLLNGLLRVVSSHSFDNITVSKMIPRLFLINYLICKLRRGYDKVELVAVCNQLPMLWTIAYQKVIKPIMDECKLADLSYNDRKFSSRLQKIRDFFDTTLTKPGDVEKAHYRKVVNMFASSSKFSDIMMREIDRFFGTLLARYNSRPQQEGDVAETLIASILIWANSTYLSAFYRVHEKLQHEDLTNTRPSLQPVGFEHPAYKEVKDIVAEAKDSYSKREEWLQDDNYRTKCLNIGRRMTSMDQFSPVWQLKFIHTRFAELLPNVSDPLAYLNQLNAILSGINGIILSPKYYGTLIKYLHKLAELKDPNSSIENQSRSDGLSRRKLDMYTFFLADHLQENVVLDNQVVGWTKLRVTINDLPSEAPLIPEYSPIISLTSSYCLDVSHLKLNSYLKSSGQLESFLAYLWRSYLPIKLDLQKDTHDMDLARNLMHLRCESEIQDDLLGSYRCGRPDNCQCVEEFIRKRVPTYNELMKVLSENLSSNEVERMQKAVKLVYFGQLNLYEYAPVFTVDPSLRSREKLEIYKSELAHVKLDLQFRNTLFYWKTGENLQLNEIELDEAALYPFATRVLVERRVKLEKSISRLRREHSNRPKSDDGSLYNKLRSDIRSSVDRYTTNIHSLMREIVMEVSSKKNNLSRMSVAKSTRVQSLIIKCEMLSKNLEKDISRLRLDFSLYGDLLTNFIVGLCFVQQGLRCIYATLKQSSTEYNINQINSFSDLSLGSMDSVHNKLELFPNLEIVCPKEEISQTQSKLLKAILIQLNHHIIITPSDIKKCIPVVRKIADLFHSAWIKRKRYFEDQKKQKEELYQYKTSRNTLGEETSYERQEFLDICAKFPTYDHLYQSFTSVPLTSVANENLLTEEKLTNLNRSVDLSMCIDICKAHYKFMKEASRSLLGQVESTSNDGLPSIDLCEIIELEARNLYTMVRHCIRNQTLDRTFDSSSLECHLLQANKMSETLNRSRGKDIQVGSLKSSIEILDEEIFDIYFNANPHEALRFQDLIYKIDGKVSNLRNLSAKSYDSHPTLRSIVKLTTKLSSLLITDPMMKLVTGSHTLLEKLEEWNLQAIPKDDKIIQEAEELVELIKSWRKIEIDSWRSSLHRVKRQYIDGALCDLWFHLYEAFNNPMDLVTNTIRERSGNENYVLRVENERLLYEGFAAFIKDFFEDATLGDYQLRLDLVFSFAIQTRFASLSQQVKPRSEDILEVDFEKLTTYVYNTYRLYQGLLDPLRETVENEEKSLTQELRTEIRVGAWQGRNLWEIKNNFRISHRKLNKVMKKYLEVLKRPLPGLRPQSNVLRNQSMEKGDQLFGSSKIEVTLASISSRIEEATTPEIKSNSFKCLLKTPKLVLKLKEVCISAHELLSTRYVDKMVEIELSIASHADAIHNFYSQNIQEVIINPKDSKNDKENKHKLCRQMLHSKKFAMQSIFKSLEGLGVSYQRGLRDYRNLDGQILSLEPLRGMIQNQSELVLKAASKLVDDGVISVCNEQYRKLIAANMFLLAQPKGDDLTSDQMNRIRGNALDLVLDIIEHKRNAALIYEGFIEIQAAISRLTELESKDSTIVHNFSRVHKTVQEFNELVGRAFLVIAKLEALAKCRRVESDIEPRAESEPDSSQRERKILKELIFEVDESNSVMTLKEFDHFNSQIFSARKTIAEVSCKLRDMLNHTRRNHLYGDDDLTRLRDLYDQFHSALSQLLVDKMRHGTVLGSIKSILNEAEEKLKPRMQSDKTSISVDDHPNLERLNIRLHKLIRESKLAAQEVYKEEQNQNPAIVRRRLKPFNHIDSSKIRKLLRLDFVTRHSGNCFATLNNEETSTDIKPIVISLAPILSIYIQNVAGYLNVILTSLCLKLNTANQLLPFFTDIVSNGFGLPFKVAEDNGTEDLRGTTKDDNAGFGEGQGDSDASKKLEFESQLDDLKKDEPSEDDKEQEETVEAHNDGVEMSDDIGGKAEGAGDKEEPAQDEEEDQSGLDELDKELDTVEQAEGRLDENLWGDEDEPPGEDDEGDLRKDEVDDDMKPKMEKTELQAKDEQLANSKPDGKPDVKSDDELKQCDEAEIDQRKAEIDQEETVDKVEEAPDHDETNPDLDLDQEASEALRENVQERQLDEADVDQNLADMSISEEESSQTKKEQGELSGDSSVEDTTEQKEDENELDAPPTPINDDEIDRKLEVALETSAYDVLENYADRTLKYREPEVEKQKHEMQGKKFGSHTVYDICEEANAHIDSDEEYEDTRADSSHNEGAAKHSCSDEDKQENGKKSDVDPVNAPEEKDDTKQRIKRTRATNEESDNIKRQRISDYVETKKDEERKEKEPETSLSGQVRHIEKDNSSAIEVVDLVSSSDDEALDGEELNEAKLQPHDEKDPRNEESGRKESEVDLSPKPTYSEASEEDKGKSSADDKEFGEISSISSIASDELGGSRYEDAEDKGSNDSNNRENLPSSYNTNLGLLKFISFGAQKEVDPNENVDLMKRIDSISGKSNSEFDSIDMDQLSSLWHDCTKRTNHLVQELCQQLQIVLQPTKMSKYKGDYKSGKRLNMRKIISYIASHYRKDKIWLRRTKPNKRTYNITIAVDNSSSMSENNCRQMTYQSLALLAKSLSLIEAGSLSVVSFGEQVKCIQDFEQPYADALGAQWLRELRFNESKTSYKLLLKHSCESFAKRALSTMSGLNVKTSISQLLIIISDGRNMTSEAEEVKSYLRQLKSMGVLTLFVIIDDLNSNPGNPIAGVKFFAANQVLNYMEHFPFPFYVLLRNIETMPSILGDALRQWFELVSTV